MPARVARRGSDVLSEHEHMAQYGVVYLQSAAALEITSLCVETQTSRRPSLFFFSAQSLGSQDLCLSVDVDDPGAMLTVCDTRLRPEIEKCVGLD